MNEVATIGALRNTLPNDPTQTGETIYLKFHTYPWDMGGGVFMWRNDNPLLMDSSSYYSDDNDGTLIHVLEENPQNPNGPKIVNEQGRWVRQYDDYINLAHFGGCKDLHATGALQAAIDFAWNNIITAEPPISKNPPTRNSSIFIPGGSYIIDRITLRDGVKLLGQSVDQPIIYAALPVDPEYTAGGYLFSMQKGVVQIEISNLNIVGRDVDKGCFHFKAELDTGGTDAGLWQSNFKNIKIWGFKGHGIYSEAGSHLPNQAIVFELINVEMSPFAPNSTSALKMTGQHGQITCIDSGFNGYNNNDKYHTGYVVSISYDTNNIASYPISISFLNSTFQEGDYGVYIDYGENITFDNCWFERLGVAIFADGRSQECRSINVLNSRFADAAGYGGAPAKAPNKFSNGICVNAINARMTVANNYVTVSNIDDGTIDRILSDIFVLAGGSSGINPGIEVYGNSFGNEILNKTNGIVQVTSITSSTLSTGYNKFVYANNPSFTIESINSLLLESETFYVRANNGDVTFNNTGNIFLTNRSELVLRNGEVAGFTKLGSNLYQLTSLVTTATP